MRPALFALVAAACAAAACSKSIPLGDAQIVCPREAYNPCNGSADCADTECRGAGSAGSGQICTESCSAPGGCPMQDGLAVPCGSDGFCAPPYPTMCAIGSNN